MRTDDMVVGAANRGKSGRKHLETDWRRAWEERDRAAQSGNYAEAERWHREATSLGAQLAIGEPARCGGHQPMTPTDARDG
jgi:branched-subunit amino acid aminotransferase/4-amino-4-deoxychorismate lyase